MRKVEDYTSALIEIAVESGKTEELSKELNLLISAYNEAPGKFITKEIFIENFEKKFAREIINFTLLLIKDDRIKFLPIISAKFWRMLFEKERKLKMPVIVTSTINLTDSQKVKIRGKLVEKFKKEVEIDFTKDANLLGGLIISAEDYFLDDCLKTKLEKLKSRVTTKKKIV